MRPLRFTDIKAQEDQVAEFTQQSLPGYFFLFVEGVDALLDQQYSDRDMDLSGVPEPLGTVMRASRVWFYSATFSFTAVRSLIERGYYAESIAIQRHLTELLVQMRYLVAHPEHFAGLPSTSSPKRKLRFKEMFEAIAPGYYGMWYDFFSALAHPGFGTGVMKLTLDPNTGTARGDAGVAYNEMWCSMCFKSCLMLLLSFIRADVLMFATPRASSVNVAERSLEKFMMDDIKFRGGENDWDRLSKPLWKPQSPAA